MPRRAFFRSFPDGAHRVGQWLAAGGAYLTRLESHIVKRDVIVSDVFGADVFVQPKATPQTVPYQAPAIQDRAHWDEALDFEPPPIAGCDDFPRFLSSGVSPGKSGARDIDAKPPGDAQALPATARFSQHDAERVLPPPLFLHRSKGDSSGDIAPQKHSAFRIRWQMFAIAACLVVVWIRSGQSDPLVDPGAPSKRLEFRNPAADALADTFADVPARTMPADLGDADPDDARLSFAPRFAVLYANPISTTGSVDSQAVNADKGRIAAADDEKVDDALSLSRDAALVMIRNLPDGTKLSAGTRVSPTDWALSSGDLSSIVVTLPDNRSGPVQATIEVFGMSGTSAGTVAVEIRDRLGGPIQSSATRRAKVYRTAGSKSSSPKRRPKPALGAQAVAKQNPSKTAVASAAPANPATQQILPQLPFLPGPHSATPPPGTTVGQQILINLGVMPSAPTIGFTQNN